MAELAKKVENKPTSYWIKVAVVLFIQIFFRYLPNFGEITDFGMAVLGIFIGTLVGWCLCDTVWPSFACLILLGFTDAGAVTPIMGKMFGNTVVVQSILSFLFSGVVLLSGMSDWAGQWLMSREFLHGRPWLLAILLVAVHVVLMPFCSIAILILLWDLVFSIAKQAGIDEGKNRWVGIMIYSVFYVVAIGNFFSWNAGIAGVVGMATAINPSDVLNAWPFLLYGFIIVVLLLVCAILPLFLIFRPDTSSLKNLKISEPPKMNKKIKICIGLIVFMIVMMIIPYIMPASWAFTGFMKHFGTVGTLALVLMISFIIPVDGKPMVNMKQAADKGLPWGPIMITGTAMTVAGILTGDGTNIVPALTSFFTPLFGGMSPFAFAAVIIIITIVLTNLLNNLVIAAIFVPIVYAMQNVIGINPFPLVVVMTYSCYVAVMLPSANPMAALMFGSGRISHKDIWTYGSISMITAAIVLIFIGYPLATVFY